MGRIQIKLWTLEEVLEEVLEDIKGINPEYTTEYIEEQISIIDHYI